MLKRFLVGLTLVLFLAASASGVQSTFYVALAKENSEFTTEIVVSNPTGSSESFTILAMGASTDGTVRDGATNEVSLTVPGGETRTFTGVTGGFGNALLEIKAEDTLAFRARLVPKNGNGLPSAIPIISSDNLIRGGTTAYLQDLERSTNIRTDVSVVNLAQVPNTCKYDVVNFGGAALIPQTQLSHPALSSNSFSDVLGLIGIDAIADAHLRVNCTGDFFLSGHLFKSDTNDLSTLIPGQAGLSTLRAPGEAAACPAGATCFDESGVFHIPSTSNLIFERNYELPANQTFGVFRATMTFQMTAWNSSAIDGVHGVLWAFFDAWSTTYAYTIMRGPNKNEIANSVVLGDKFKRDVNYAAPEGTTFQYEYVYDARGGSIVTSLRLLDGTEVVRISDGARSNNINPRNFPLSIWVGNGWGHVEVPSFGWVYQDLHLELIP